MPDYPQSERDIQAIYHSRMEHHTPRIALQNTIAEAVKGNLGDDYDRLFNEDEVRMEVRTIRTADDDLTALTSKVFPIVVQPKGTSEKAKKESERVEKIAYGWNHGARLRGGPTMKGIMDQLARHQVRFADGCLVTYPDYERKHIFFHVVDPRNHLSPVGWTPWGQVPLDNTLICYETRLGPLRMRYPGAYTALNNAFRNASSYSDEPDDHVIVKVCEFYSKGAWYVVAVNGHEPVYLAQSEEGDPGHPGVCPVTAFTQFAMEPLFTGQIGLEAAASKVLSQEINATDQMLHGPIIGPPLTGGDLRWGAYNTIDTAVPGSIPQMQRLAPDSPLNTERVLGNLVSLIRVFNRNPESFQGAGDANSAKAVQTLQAGIRSTVEDILWSPFTNFLPRVYDNCLNLELKLWPNERKKAIGKAGKTSFEIDYIPSVHLKGWEGWIEIEPGLGLGGYQAKLDMMQHYGAGLISMETLLEQHPDVRDARSERQRIHKEETEKQLTAAFEALAGQDPAMAITALVAINKKIEGGKSKAEAIAEIMDEGMLAPPEPEIPEMGGGPPGGLPPELMAMMGGGEPAALPPPGMI